MLLLAVMLGIGLLLGWGFGGSLRNLGAVHVRLWVAYPVALVLQVIPLPELEGESGRLLPMGVLLLSFAILIVVSVANWRLFGFILMAVGLTLNFVVIGMNFGMPVTRDAAFRAGGREAVARLTEHERGRHHLATEDDVLTFLGDAIGVRPPFGVVVSVGDLLAYAGASGFLAVAMTGRAVRRPPKEQAGPPPVPRTWTSGTPR